MNDLILKFELSKKDNTVNYTFMPCNFDKLTDEQFNSIKENFNMIYNLAKKNRKKNGKC